MSDSPRPKSLHLNPLWLNHLRREQVINPALHQPRSTQSCAVKCLAPDGDGHGLPVSRGPGLAHSGQLSP